MKRCPYCAEWIQDEAVKCRYCQTDLAAQGSPPGSGPADGPPSAATAEATPGQGAMRFSHSGFRYVLGFGDGFFGIWERDRPGGPVERFPRTDQGWAEAWNRFQLLEPRAVEVPAAAGPTPSASVASPAIAPASVATPGVAEAPAGGPRIGEGALRFSHSGLRYVLGYAQDYFGIWDRQAPGGPVLRFPRNDEGWVAAWNRFTAWEPKAVEVPAVTGPAPDLRMRPAGTFRPAHGLAVAATVLISLCMLLALLAVALWGNHLATLGAFENGTSSFQDVVDSRDAALGADGFLFFLIVATAIVWLIWQYRSHANLSALGASGLKYTPGWVVGWWFIPIANVAVPYLTMRELVKASDPDAGSVEWMSKRTPPLLGLWWAGRLLTQVFFQIGFAIGENNPIPDLRLQSWMFIVGNLVLIAWGVLAVLLVRTIDARQAVKQQRMAAWTRSLAGPA